MTENKLIQLVKSIEKRTKEGALIWESTAANNEFQSTLASVVIRIRRDATGDAGFDFVISLFDSNGAELESLSDRDLKKMLAKSAYAYEPGLSDAYELMESVFKNAKRKALGVDAALDQMLSDLHDEDPTA